MKKKSTFLIIYLFTFISLWAEDYIFDIPGVGEVGIKYENGDTYAAAIPALGTYEFHGYINDLKDFDLQAELPAGDLTGYIPVLGQILDIFGLDTATYIIKPSGMGIHVHLENGGLGALRGHITDALSAVPELKSVINEIIGLLELEVMDMNGYRKKMNFNGSIKGKLSLAGKSISFKTSGDLNASKIIQAIVVDLPAAGLEYLMDKSLDTLEDTALVVGNAVADAADEVYKEAKVIAHDVSSSVSHSTHELNTCLYTCVPNYAYPIAGKMLYKSNQMVLDYYVKLGPSMNFVSDLEKRKQLINKSWSEMEKALDSKWKKIYNDDEVDNYFFKNSSEKKGRKAYKAIIQREWDLHKSYRKGIHHNLVDSAKTPLELLSYWARHQKAVLMTHEDSKYCVTLNNAAYKNGSNIVFYEHTGGNHQMWYFHSVKGKADTYTIQSAATGKYVSIKDDSDKEGKSIVINKNRKDGNTEFTASVDSRGYFHFKTVSGLSFDLKGGKIGNHKNLQIAKADRSDDQRFTLLEAPVQPDLRPGYYNIRNGIGSLYLTVNNKDGDDIDVFLKNKNNKKTQTFLVYGGTGMSGRQTWRFYNKNKGQYIKVDGINKFWPGREIEAAKEVKLSGENLKFWLEKQRGNKYIIRTKRGNIMESMDSEKNTKAGSDAGIYWDKGAKDQRWYLEEISVF